MANGVSSTESKPSDDHIDVIIHKFLLRSSIGTAFYIILCIITGGIYYLLSRWYIVFKLLQYSNSDPLHASHVMVSSPNQRRSIHKLRRENVPESVLGHGKAGKTLDLIIFKYRFMIYVVQDDSGTCKELQYDVRIPCSTILDELSAGVSDEDERRIKKDLYGECLIDVPMPNIFHQLVNEILHPFYLFQVFSVILWLFEEYILFACIIGGMAILSAIVTMYETRKNIRKIRNMSLYECEIKVKSEDSFITTSSKNLVPGDVIEIAENMILPCDVLILSGGCLVDESMLTGESVPVLKEKMVHIPQVYDYDKKYLLCSGTLPIQCRPETFGLVICTGFATTKGELVRNILYPRPNRFKFNRDSFLFMAILGLLSMAGFFWVLPDFLERGTPDDIIVLRCLDLITITIPPSLPFAMSIGIQFAINRMKKKGVSCISPPAVNAAGRISVISFDKTGTLTEDQMVLKGAWDVTTQSVHSSLTEIDHSFKLCLATCHSLALLNGTLVGDPMETAIFQDLGWSLNEENSNYRCRVSDGKMEANIVHLYHFSPILKRMGVIVKTEDGTTLQVKGAAEEVLKLCKDVPEGMDKLIHAYARQGYRILACAYRKVKKFRAENTLHDYENGLHFLGLILLQNKVKEITPSVLDQLKKARIRTLMSTGDALLTGLAVAKECDMISNDKTVQIIDIQDDTLIFEDEEGYKASFEDSTKHVAYAVSGKALEYMHNTSFEGLDIVIKQGVVFGRMSPAHKILLIELLQVGDTMVAMCGDGANDCGALKAADVGLSLSTAEASIAAPFNGETLDKIIVLLIEGRASLVTSFQCFKFMALYSMIQFSCVEILYKLDTLLTNTQFVYCDLFLIIPLAVSMGYTDSYHKLSKEMPPGSLISVSILASIFGSIIIQVTTLGLTYYILYSMSWFSAHDGSVDIPEANRENASLFIVSNFQYIYTCLIFSIGPPFRKSAWKNLWFIGVVILVVAMSIVIMWNTNDDIYDLMTTVYLREAYLGYLSILIFSAALVSWLYEKFPIFYLSKRFNK
jgi:cation-transporting ATPase 13A2